MNTLPVVLAERIVRGVAVTYLGLALLKLLAAVGEIPLLARPNPVLEPLTYRQVLLLAALLEGVAGWLAWRAPTGPMRLVAASWMTLVLMAYRGALVWMGVGLPCSCLGPAAAWLGWSAATEAAVSRWLLAALGIACGLAWALEWVAGRSRCGVPVRADAG